MRLVPIIEELQEGNRRFVVDGWDPADRELAAPPAKRLAVVACMDTRYNVERVLGLSHGDAKIIRNAGPSIDDGTLRSLVVAVHLLDVRHIVVMGHTKCGMTTVGHGQFRIAKSIASRSSVPLHELMRPDFQRWLGGFPDVEAHVRQGVEILRNHPYIPEDVEVTGLVYDNDTGQIHELEDLMRRKRETPSGHKP